MTILMVTHDQADALALGRARRRARSRHVQQCDTPEALYRQPATEFVARFIGDPPMSIFDAAIADQRLTLTATETPTRLSLPPEIAPRFSKGPLRVGFRPETFESIRRAI